MADGLYEIVQNCMILLLPHIHYILYKDLFLSDNQSFKFLSNFLLIFDNNFNKEVS